MITISEIRPDRHLLSIDGEPQLILSDRERDEYLSRETLLESLKREMDGLKGEIRVLRTDA